jgi:hypothetical protein
MRVLYCLKKTQVFTYSSQFAKKCNHKIIRHITLGSTETQLT